MRAQYKQQQGDLAVVHQRARKSPWCWAVVGTVCTFLLAQCWQPRNGPIRNDVLADWGARIRGWLERPYISRIRPICTKFGLRVCLMDVSNSATFYHNRLRGSDFLGSNFDHSHRNAMLPLTLLVLTFRCDQFNVVSPRDCLTLVTCCTMIAWDV